MTEPKKYFTWTQIKAAISVSLGSLVVGFTSAWSSPAIASLQSEGSAIPISDTEASWVGSLMPLAALVGGLSGGAALDKIGRKTTIISTSLPFIAAGLLVTFASNVYIIYAGRAIAGFCIGVISLSLPVYLAETIHPEVRGRLGMLPTTLGNMGVLICYACGAWMDWSQLSLVAAVIPIPFLAMMCQIPESPTFLMSKQKNMKALKSLEWLRGQNIETSDEFLRLKSSQKENTKPRTKGFPLTRSDLHPLSLCLGLMMFQQLSGINAVMFYSVSIFVDSGSASPHISTVILGVVNIFATILSNLLIDRLGRKVLLYISSIGMMISLCVLGVHYHTEAISTVTPLIALVVYIISFSFGFGPIPWLLMGELLPSRSRGTCAAITTGANWAATFAVTKTFLDLKSAVGAATVFWMYGLVCGAALAFTMVCVPETRGKSLEEIERLFIKQNDISVFDDEETRINRSSIANLKSTPSQLL